MEHGQPMNISPTHAVYNLEGDPEREEKLGYAWMVGTEFILEDGRKFTREAAMTAGMRFSTLSPEGRLNWRID